MRMRMLPFNLVAGLLILVLLLSLYATERSWILQERPVVAHLGSIRQPADFDLAETLDDYGIHLIRPGSHLQRFAAALRTALPFAFEAPITVPAAGHSISEFGFFGMPFGWKTDLGNVIYVRNEREYVYAQLNRRGVASVTAANEGDVFAGRMFPFWTHAWGWAWVAGSGLAIWLWFREMARRREEAGVI